MCNLCSDAGGGGERVLWVLIDALLNDAKFRNKVHIIIYSSETKCNGDIYNNTMVRFYSSF